MIPVVIPVKPLRAALGRLSGLLGAEERRALQAAMLGDVLSAATAFSRRVVVVTSDAVIATMAREQGAVIAPDSDPPKGIDAAVARGIAATQAHAVLVVMGDLPCATLDDLRQVALAHPGGRGIVCAVSRDGTGTNAMMLTPPEVIGTAFGHGSLARHVATAERVGVESTLVTAPGLMLDVDTPADITAFMRVGGDSHAGRLMGTFGLGERFAAVTGR